MAGKPKETTPKTREKARKIAEGLAIIFDLDEEKKKEVERQAYVSLLLDWLHKWKPKGK